jgi:hypothetical protein
MLLYLSISKLSYIIQDEILDEISYFFKYKVYFKFITFLKIINCMNNDEFELVI